MTPSYLVIGGAGMLGRAFQERFRAADAHFRALDLPEIDITRSESIREHVRPRDIVINCAAWTDVDGAETNEAQATNVNGRAVELLARVCLDQGAKLVHYSTDYVFNGRATHPYPVDAQREPVNAYGRSKAVGEAALEAAMASGLEALLIRTSWLYAPWAKNFVRTIASLAKTKPSLRVVDDQRGRPTSSEHLAASTLDLLRAGARGAFHLTDGGECTWHGFATEIARRINPSCRVDPCSTAEFPRPATRPAYSVLDLSKAESIIGPRPSWQSQLSSVLDRLEW